MAQETVGKGVTSAKPEGGTVEKIFFWMLMASFVYFAGATALELWTITERGQVSCRVMTLSTGLIMGGPGGSQVNSAELDCKEKNEEFRASQTNRLGIDDETWEGLALGQQFICTRVAGIVSHVGHLFYGASLKNCFKAG